MKDGDMVRSKFNNSVGKFVKVNEYNGYIESIDDSAGQWRTPECTIKDIAQYWRVIPNAID
jgi:hypothetical protein